MTTSASPQPITDILSRVATELTDLAQSVNQLHALVEGFGGAGDETARDHFLHNAQSIDLVEQRLSSLSHFLLEMNEIIPPHWEITGRAAAQKLKLSALAHRLSAPEGHLHLGHVAGDLEFF